MHIKNLAEGPSVVQEEDSSEARSHSDTPDQSEESESRHSTIEPLEPSSEPYSSESVFEPSPRKNPNSR